jgi:fructose-1,6-bisphosphatase/inositol monophosphatase family enzyme
MTSPDALLEVFKDAADAVRRAVAAIDPAELRARTPRAGQYALDLAADAEACRVLQRAGVRIVSEESGVHEHAGASITVVLDPVDGSTNCSRRIPYWATSICALDGSGMLAAVVMNHATGEVFSATRGQGALRDGLPVRPSAVRKVEDAMVGLSGWPARLLPWLQYRALGCASLALCSLAAGGLDGYIDGGAWHAPWDYLGGLLVCREAGASVVDIDGQELVTPALSARRQLLGAGTPELLAALRPSGGRR